LTSYKVLSVVAAKKASPRLSDGSADLINHPGATKVKDAASPATSSQQHSESQLYTNLAMEVMRRIWRVSLPLLLLAGLASCQHEVMQLTNNNELRMSDNDIVVQFQQVFKLPEDLARRLTFADQVPDIKTQLQQCQADNRMLRAKVAVIDDHVACIIKNIKKPNLVAECPCGGCSGKGDCLHLSLGRYKCNCKKGFEGEHCEISDCPSGCNLKFGSCVSGRCVCKPGYTGTKCNNRSCPNDCTDRAHGRCIKKTGICKCKRGYTGKDCGLRRN